MPCLRLSAWSDLMTQLFCRSLTVMIGKNLSTEVCREEERFMEKKSIDLGIFVSLQCKWVTDIFWHAWVRPLVYGCVSLGLLYACDVTDQSIIQQQCQTHLLQFLSWRGLNTTLTLKWAGEHGRERERCREGWEKNFKRKDKKTWFKKW